MLVTRFIQHKLFLYTRLDLSEVFLFIAHLHLSLSRHLPTQLISVGSIVACIAARRHLLVEILQHLSHRGLIWEHFSAGL